MQYPLYEVGLSYVMQSLLFKEKEMERIHGRTVQKKKILMNPDNDNGVVNHPEPDTLECEVK